MIDFLYVVRILQIFRTQIEKHTFGKSGKRYCNRPNKCLTRDDDHFRAVLRNTFRGQKTFHLEHICNHMRRNFQIDSPTPAS